MPGAVDQTSSSATESGTQFPGHRPLRPNSYRLTHPKNYVGVPLAVAAPTPAEVLVDDHLVAMAGAAKVGARALGYLTPTDQLTPAGERIVTAASDHYGSPAAALTTLENDKIRYGQFAEQAPVLASAGREPLGTHPGVQIIVDVLDADGPLSLPELAVRCFEQAPTRTAGFLLVDEDETLDVIAGATLEDPPAVLNTPDAYPSETTYQFKSVLAHFGILTTPGADSATLDPTTDTWALGAAAAEVTR
jgi:hypothetical protein